MSDRIRPLLAVCAGLSVLALSILSSGADDFFTRAAEQFRDKEYGEAYLLAAKSAVSSQRSFLLGTAALRMGKPEEALPLLVEAEQKLPLIADYATFYQAEALLKLRKYADASAKVALIPKSFPASLLLRRSEKLAADILREAGDLKGAFKAYQSFVEKYASGADSVDALYQSALCREETGDKTGALQTYRNIWINNPAAVQARLSLERLKNLEKDGLKMPPLSAEELLKRASSLYSQNEFTASLKTLESADVSTLSAAVVSRIELRTGMAYYRLRQYKPAEKHLARASAGPVPGISSEARFWLAKTLERQEQNDRAVAIFTELSSDGKRQEFSDDALMELAGLKRSLGLPAEAAGLYEQIPKRFPESKFVSRSAWEAGWSHYLAGEFAAAVELFKVLQGDAAQREKALYWQGRAYENNGNSEAATCFNVLLEEFPAGFYATWYRDQRGIKDSRESLGKRNAAAELPLLAGFEKPRLLASLGMLDDARTEMAAARKKAGDKKGLFPGYARIYLEMGDYSSAISLFLQNRPVAWEKTALPLWSAGYPLTYSELVSRHADANSLSEGLVYALIRAESSFSPSVKSPAGAVGLMQLMPATAKKTAREKGTFNPERLVLPEYNIRLGTKHLNDLMKEYNGDVIHVAAAYNAGSAALERWRKNLKGLKKDEFIESIPYQETRDYVKKVYASAATYRQLYGIK